MIVLSAEQIEEGLRVSGWNVPENCLHLVDSDYSLISSEHAKDFFWALAQEAFTFIGSAWQPNKTDCDKYARVVQAIGMAAHARQSSEDTGLALATIGYEQDMGGGHAINILLTAEKGKTILEVRTFEPQTGDEVFLSRNERENGIKFMLF